MGKIERFEDIEAWGKARELVRNIYKITGRGEFAKDYGLKDQIRRAAVSIMSNIAEGFERGGNREFTQFLAIAKGSSGEVRSQLYVALDNEFIKQEEFKQLYDQVEEISRLLNGFIKYLAKSSMKGSKFK